MFRWLDLQGNDAVNDETSNVIETQEQAGDFKEP
jgi:hypothetical protein